MSFTAYLSALAVFCRPEFEVICRKQSLYVLCLFQRAKKSDPGKLLTFFVVLLLVPAVAVLLPLSFYRSAVWDVNTRERPAMQREARLTPTTGEWPHQNMRGSGHGTGGVAHSLPPGG